MSTPTDQAERRHAARFSARRHELADSALSAIAERGFANIGLREISARASVSTGTLNYYFAGKSDLISQAIWQQKSVCARRYDPIIDTAVTTDEFLDRFGEEITATLRDESDMHRLWYDLRTQAFFQEGFRETIIAIDALLADMVWAVVVRHAELRGGQPTIDRKTAYALFDGVFLNCLIEYLRGDPNALDELRARTRTLLTTSV